MQAGPTAARLAGDRAGLRPLPGDKAAAGTSQARLEPPSKLVPGKRLSWAAGLFRAKFQRVWGDLPMGTGRRAWRCTHSTRRGAAAVGSADPTPSSNPTITDRPQGGALCSPHPRKQPVIPSCPQRAPTPPPVGSTRGSTSSPHHPSPLCPPHPQHNTPSPSR